MTIAISNGMNKAIFIDKDGTLIPDIPYNADPEKITLENNGVEGLKQLQDSGYLLIIISNQAGVAKGFFEENRLLVVENRIRNLLSGQGIHLDGFYYCPHHPEGKLEKYRLNCSCRKPAPGMLLKAANELNINLSQSWMIGDILNDMEAGYKAGCKTILIDNGNETEWLLNTARQPNFKAKTINQAAGYIIAGAVTSNPIKS